MGTHRRELAGPILKALGGAAANQETRTDACEQAHEPRHQTKEGDDEVEEREAGPAGAHGSTEREQMRTRGGNMGRASPEAHHRLCSSVGWQAKLHERTGGYSVWLQCCGAHNEARDGDALGLVGLLGQVGAVGAHRARRPACVGRGLGLGLGSGVGVRVRVGVEVEVGVRVRVRPRLRAWLRVWG